MCTFPRLCYTISPFHCYNYSTSGTEHLCPNPLSTHAMYGTQFFSLKAKLQELHTIQIKQFHFYLFHSYYYYFGTTSSRLDFPINTSFKVIVLLVKAIGRITAIHSSFLWEHSFIKVQKSERGIKPYLGTQANVIQQASQSFPVVGPVYSSLFLHTGGVIPMLMSCPCPWFQLNTPNVCTSVLSLS